MKKSKKNVIFIILTFFAIIFAPIKSKAGIEKINNNSSTYIVKISSISDLLGYTPGPISDGDTQIVANKVGPILNTITTIGMVLGVLVIIIIGIKYMLGSVEEKAEYKKTMIPYLVGAIMITGIVAILKTFSGIISNILS